MWPIKDGLEKKRTRMSDLQSYGQLMSERELFLGNVKDCLWILFKNFK